MLSTEIVRVGVLLSPYAAAVARDALLGTPTGEDGAVFGSPTSGVRGYVGFLGTDPSGAPLAGLVLELGYPPRALDEGYVLDLVPVSAPADLAA